jgi:DNA polymerase-3 subunit epsilon
MSRAVLFDTETTGLDPLTGDRVIEIAALELFNDLPTGKRLHLLIDPQRDIPDEASRIHGFTRSHLHGKPVFADIADQVIAFFDDSPLVAHNAAFDFGFLNAEFSRIGHPPLGRHRMIDTLALAKTRFPGLPNSLDALCRRFGIDLSERTTHNALLDCRLLAEVYVELTGGRQRGLTLAPAATTILQTYAATRSRTPRPIVPTTAERAAHAAFISRLKGAIWLE